MDFFFTQILQWVQNDNHLLVWNVRCQAQVAIEKGLGINNRMKKQKNTSRNKLPRLDLDRNLYSSSLTYGQLGVGYSIRSGGHWAGFMAMVNRFLRFAPCLSGSTLIP